MFVGVLFWVAAAASVFTLRKKIIGINHFNFLNLLEGNQDAERRGR